MWGEEGGRGMVMMVILGRMVWTHKEKKKGGDGDEKGKTPPQSNHPTRVAEVR